ncbi:hypothetical protein CWI47_03725 [Neisseria meningitidis]|nr:hypothetical protein CWI47_03725 [Neisseria meningitidis]
MGFPLLKKIDVAPMGQNFILQKPVRRCLALAQRERFSKVLKHQVPRLAVLFVLSAASSPCPDLNLIHYSLKLCFLSPQSMPWLDLQS